MNRKDTCLKCKSLNLFLNLQQAFYCWFISRILVVTYKKNNICRKLIFFKTINPEKKLLVVHSILSRKHIKFEGTWSLFLEQRSKTTYIFLQFLFSWF